MSRPGRVMIGIVLAAGIFFAGYLANRHPQPTGSPGSVKQAATYTCPMHPQYTSDHAGDCPLCGMRLVPAAGNGSRGPSGRRRPRQWWSGRPANS